MEKYKNLLEVDMNVYNVYNIYMIGMSVYNFLVDMKYFIINYF